LDAFLNIDLQSGFDSDKVTIRINNKQVYCSSSVTTKLLLGYADSFEVPVPQGPTTIELAVQSRGLEKSWQYNVIGRCYLGIFLRKGEIRSVFSREPFGYA
jgi:hypothetical protein